MSNESRMMFASIAEDHARSDHEALADTAMIVTEQLEAANQRELGLLAVIEKMKSALVPFSESPHSTHFDKAPCHNGLTTREQCSRCSRGLAAYHAMNIEPSQALREHEAKVLEEVAKELDDSGYHNEADGLRVKAEERRKK